MVSFDSVIGQPFANKHSILSIEKKVVDNLLENGRVSLPNEYSALLAGRDSTIVSFISANEEEQTPHAFIWNGPTLITALKHIQAEGLSWLGVLHTHPHTPPIPSISDIKGWHYPSLSYWILSFSEKVPKLVMYQWVEHAFVQKEYRII